MRRVGERPLWVGTARDARDMRAVHDAGIEAVVDLAVEEEPVRPTRELVYLRFPLHDGGGNPVWLVMAAATTIADLLRLEVPTLVACGGGMSRSPAVAALGLCFEAYGRAPDMYLRRVQQHAPSDVHPALWNDIMRCVRDDGEWQYRPRD